MKTPEQWAHEKLTANPGIELVEVIRQAMQQAREQALEEAAAYMDDKYPFGFNGEDEYNNNYGDEIRALKNKGA